MRLNILAFISVALSLSSCGFYTRHILFRADQEMEKEFRKAASSIITPPNYLIQKNDYLEFFMVTNKGEILVDPTSEFAKQAGGGVQAGGASLKYLVQHDGKVELPILGRVKVDSLTLSQCDSFLSKQYSKYYFEPFVKCKISNRRVFLLGLGATMSMVGGGGGGIGGGSGGARVIVLETENVTIAEFFAMAGIPAPFSHSNRIKIIRGDLKNPKIFTLDLTHINAFKNDNLLIQPNDIVYVEPAVRIVFDVLRDVSVYTGIFTTIISIYLLTRL
jgi:polysaccharide export outer membrane protein